MVTPGRGSPTVPGRRSPAYTETIGIIMLLASVGSCGMAALGGARPNELADNQTEMVKMRGYICCTKDCS